MTYGVFGFPLFTLRYFVLKKDAVSFLKFYARMPHAQKTFFKLLASVSHRPFFSPACNSASGGGFTQDRLRIRDFILLDLGKAPQDRA
jgi:hypothetical protein